MNKVNLETFAGGALQEKFDETFERVLKNMQDPNTPYKNKRSITIKINFTQNEDRNDTGVEVSVEAKLAPVTPINTRMAIGTDLKTNKVYAEEYGPQIRGQMSLEDLETPISVDGKEVDPETGEILEKDTVVDFRKAGQA